MNLHYSTNAPIVLLFIATSLLKIPNNDAFVFSTRHIQENVSMLFGSPSSSSNELQLSAGISATNMTYLNPQQKQQTETALTFLAEAQKLRAEAESLRIALDEEKAAKKQREIAKIDAWINDLLVNRTIDSRTEMLNNVEQVFDRLIDGRYNQEQINKVFKRMCDTAKQPQSRSNCSPLMTTFVDAVGRVDSLEREENPNRRWNGRVERVLRRKLFLNDYFQPEEEEDDDSDSNLMTRN